MSMVNAETPPLLAVEATYVHKQMREQKTILLFVAVPWH